LRRLKEQILEFDRMIRAWHRSSEMSMRLDEAPGVGQVLATALVATVADPKAFRSGRNFSADSCKVFFSFGPVFSSAQIPVGHKTAIHRLTTKCCALIRLRRLNRKFPIRSAALNEPDQQQVIGLNSEFQVGTFLQGKFHGKT